MPISIIKRGLMSSLSTEIYSKPPGNSITSYDLWDFSEDKMNISISRMFLALVLSSGSQVAQNQ